MYKCARSISSVLSKDIFHKSLRNTKGTESDLDSAPCFVLIVWQQLSQTKNIYFFI